MSQVLRAFGLLNFTMLRPVLFGGLFETYELFIYLNFNFFPGRDKQRILNQWIQGHNFSYFMRNVVLVA
jgi:hypothetical protein